MRQPQLLVKEAPRAAENFRLLCTGERGVHPSGTLLSLVGCPVHLILPGKLVQSGDITNGDGTGGCGALSDTFDDEGLGVKVRALPLHHPLPLPLSPAAVDGERRTSRGCPSVGSRRTLEGTVPWPCVCAGSLHPGVGDVGRRIV